MPIKFNGKTSVKHPITETMKAWVLGDPDELSLIDAIMMTNRGGKICLAAFPHKPVEINIPHMVINNIYMFGIRGEGKSATHRAMQFMKEKRFDAKLVHTHTFNLSDLPTALKYARERIDDAIKIVIKPWS